MKGLLGDTQYAKVFTQKNRSENYVFSMVTYNFLNIMPSGHIETLKFLSLNQNKIYVSVIYF